MDTIISLSAMLYIGFLIIALIIFLNMLSQAFKFGFFWGILCLLFPPGTIIYCKKKWDVTKKLAIPFTICVIGGIIFKLLEIWLV